MAAEFKKLPRKLYTKPPIKQESKEQLYWKSFQFPTIVKEFSPVHYVTYLPNEPYDCLVTNYAKIQIFDKENTVKRSSSRTKENVYGARFREDGKLMIAGGDSGLVQVLDVASRAILRNLNGHTKATKVCSFSKEATKIFSASDDKTARYWDLPTGNEITQIKPHKDYIRCGCIHQNNNDLFMTGSYDHTVKLWDTRASSCVMEMDHGAPVECILIHQNGSLCISSGGNYIKVWDILGGSGRLFRQFSNHQKTITTVCFDGEYGRLLSGGLDRYVKIYDANDNYALVANINYPSPVLAMDISGDGNHLAVGMADGAISFRHRIKNKANDTLDKRKRRNASITSGTYKYRIRNQLSKPDKDDIIIKKQYGKKLGKIDKYLRKFQYREAFDFALSDPGAFPSYIISVLIELSRQNALESVLDNRNAESLKDIVLFLTRNITTPRYAKILMPIANLLIDKYSHLVGESKKFDECLKRLSNRISEDMQPSKDIMKLLGALDQIFCMMEPPPVFQNNADDDQNRME